MKTSVKAAVKRGDLSNAKTLAKELVRSRKATNRMHASKATMNSVMMQMENQLGARPSFTELPLATPPHPCCTTRRPLPLLCPPPLWQRK